MKKVVVVVSAFMLIASLTFGQNQQTNDKGKTPAKTEQAPKKDSKDCSKSCTMHKSSCCEKKGAEQKDTKAPEKK